MSEDASPPEPTPAEAGRAAAPAEGPPAMPAVRLVGRFRRLPVVVDVGAERVVIGPPESRTEPPLERFEIPLADLSELSVRTAYWTGGAKMGLLAVVMAVGALVRDPGRWWVGFLFALAGLLAIGWRQLRPVSVLRLMSRGRAFEITLDPGHTAAAEELALRLAAEGRGRVAKAPPRVGPIAHAGLSAALASDASMRAQYRRAFGDSPSAAEEERHVRVTRRVARWNVAWCVIGPLVATVLMQIPLPAASAAAVLLRALAWLPVWLLAALIAQHELRRAPRVRAWLYDLGGVATPPPRPQDGS